MNIVVTGTTGRMGMATIAEIIRRDSVSIAFTTSQKTSFELSNYSILPGVDVCNNVNFMDRLSESNADVLIDFTTPESSLFFAESAAQLSIPIVIGTTGFTEEQFSQLNKLSTSIPILFSANFSRGISSILLAIDAISGILSKYDIEITETHHNMKIDSPSGTALSIFNRLDQKIQNLHPIYGRHGRHERELKEVGIHSRRAGNSHGEHEIIFSGNDESIILTHRAENRGVYASGAVDSAIWISERSPGWYGFEDVLEVSI